MSRYLQPVSIVGSLANLGTGITTTGLKTPQPIPLGMTSLRLNIWGTGTFDVQVQGQMFDGQWYTLPAINALTGSSVGNDVATAGIYDFDIAGFQNIVLNVVSVTGGNVNAEGVLLP